MKISTKGRYAVRLLLDIAMNDEVEPVRLKDVAERQDISMKYLEQIISTLVRAGFVKSIRGPREISFIKDTEGIYDRDDITSGRRKSCTSIVS